MSKSQYQTVPLPDGEVQLGLFPTIEWYQAFTKYGQFHGSRVLDLGCCQFSYGIQALRDGAEHVVGIDHDEIRVRQSCENVKHWGFEQQSTIRNQDAVDYIECLYSSFDVVIIGMLLHWLPEDRARILLRASWRNTSKGLFIIYRLPTVDGTGFCPTPKDLDHILETEARGHEILMDTETQRIGLAVYDRPTPFQSYE